MDGKTCAKVQPVARSTKKKKQVKDEFDRIKQAEKKKRRLEKALATSAAIRAELEKKKQKKKEEQQRLDEEGAAIAEAVALHVLLGDENANDSSEIVTNEEQHFNPWACTGNIEALLGGRDGYVSYHYRRHPNHATQGFDWLANAYGYGGCASELINWDWCSFSYVPPGAEPQEPYYDDAGWGHNDLGLSAGLLAARAVSSLQISGQDEVDTILLDRMFR